MNSRHFISNIQFKKRYFCMFLCMHALIKLIALMVFDRIAVLDSQQSIHYGFYPQSLTSVYVYWTWWFSSTSISLDFGEKFIFSIFVKIEKRHQSKIYICLNFSHISNHITLKYVLSAHFLINKVQVICTYLFGFDTSTQNFCCPMKYIFS